MAHIKDFSPRQGLHIRSRIIRFIARMLRVKIDIHSSYYRA